MGVASVRTHLLTWSHDWQSAAEERPERFVAQVLNYDASYVFRNTVCVSLRIVSEVIKIKV